LFCSKFLISASFYRQRAAVLQGHDDDATDFDVWYCQRTAALLPTSMHTLAMQKAV
jgi:hypothetical protein